MKKKILIASNLYKPNIGGVENSLDHMAQSYAQQGYDVIIYASDISRLGTPLAAMEKEGAVTVLRYKVANYKGAHRYLMHWINGTKLFIKIRKEHNPDLVISRFHLSCLMMSLAGFKNYLYVVPGVVKYQNAFLKNITGFLGKAKGYVNYGLNCWFQHLALKKSAAIFVFSENMRQQVCAVTPQVEGKIRIVKPGVDLQRFELLERPNKIEKRQSLGLSTEAPVFLCLGRAVAAKGFDLVVLAMTKLPDGELWIVGEGDEIIPLKTLAEKHNILSQVHFIPATNKPEAYYAAADYFVMSSRYEPLGQTILEALACGLPIVAFRNAEDITTATEELLGPDGAFYAESATAQGLAVAMLNAQQSLHSAKYLQIAEQNRLLAKTKYSWPALCKQLMGNEEDV